MWNAIIKRTCLINTLLFFFSLKHYTLAFVVPVLKSDTLNSIAFNTTHCLIYLVGLDKPATFYPFIMAGDSSWLLPIVCCSVFFQGDLGEAAENVFKKEATKNENIKPSCSI